MGSDAAFFDSLCKEKVRMRGRIAGQWLVEISALTPDPSPPGEGSNKTVVDRAAGVIGGPKANLTLPG